MRRRTKDEKVTRLRARKLAQEIESLPEKLARWAEDHSEQLAWADPAMPEGLNDRAEDCWRPLIAIAEQIGGDWPELSRRAAEALSGEISDRSRGVMLLQDIRTIFAEKSSLPSEELVSALIEMEDR